VKVSGTFDGSPANLTDRFGFAGDGRIGPLQVRESARISNSMIDKHTSSQIAPMHQYDAVLSDGGATRAKLGTG
jgi:hypothetical protein